MATPTVPHGYPSFSAGSSVSAPATAERSVARTSPRLGKYLSKKTLALVPSVFRSFVNDPVAGKACFFVMARSNLNAYCPLVEVSALSTGV